MQRAGIAALEGGKKEEGETMHKKKGVESGASSSSIPLLQTGCQTPVPVHTAKSDPERQTEEEATSRFGPLPRVGGASREGRRDRGKAPSDGLTD